MWASMILAAERYGTPVWEMCGGPKLIWWYRHVEFNNLRNKPKGENA